MTAEQYYWYIRRPQLLRAKFAGCSSIYSPQPQICKVAFSGTNCRCEINGEEGSSKIVPIGSNVKVEVFPNDGYMFTQWEDGNTDNPRIWYNVQDNLTADAKVYEDFGPLCFTNTEGFGIYITLKSRETGKGDIPVNDIYPNLNLQYSSNGIDWMTYNMTQKPSVNKITIENGEKVYFKAITSNPDGFGHDLYFSITTPFGGGKISLTGSIMYLLDSYGKTRTVPENAFIGLFSQKVSQESVSTLTMPKIPADNLGSSCCKEMFKGCYNLIVNETNAPGRIPWSVNASGTVADNWSENMLSSTGGDFTDDPQNGVTYYIGS